jgi:hypothetical protein
MPRLGATLGRLGTVLCAVLSAACADSTEPRRVWVVDIGVLPDMPFGVVVIPDTVVVGRPVDAIVNTVGSSSCTRPAGVEIVGEGTRLQTLTPRDSFAVRAICTDDLAARPHPVRLTFDEAGLATIRVRAYVLDRSMGRRLGTVERQIVVRQ